MAKSDASAVMMSQGKTSDTCEMTEREAASRLASVTLSQSINAAKSEVNNDADSSAKPDGDVDEASWMPFVPREVWEKCFDYLTPNDLAAVAKTCSLFYGIVSDPRFWRNVDFGKRMT